MQEGDREKKACTYEVRGDRLRNFGIGLGTDFLGYVANFDLLQGNCSISMRLDSSSAPFSYRLIEDIH